ncbi:unnamed protein product [Owenia fusiformis]|uniref:Uncharacterized protein n=1 Tax=Owenia fusiformis TaxID=6347 RepID=A0A8J1XIE5_OWEFU|nr:unnamed protein product [Owenia fusiformis]
MQPQAPPVQEYPSQVPPGVVYAVQTPTRPGPRVWPNFNGKASTVLGGLQVACGILAVIFGIAAIGVHASIYQSGAGIWCGFLFFMVTGAFGIVAGKAKTTGWIVAFMVMSIITAVIGCVTLLTIASIGTAIDSNRREYECKTDWLTGRHTCTYVYVYSGSEKLGINSMLIVISLVEAVLCIVSAGYCCAAVCCCRQNNQTRVQVVHSGYPNLGMQQHQIPAVINGQQVLTNGQQVIYITNTNPVAGHYPQQQTAVYPVNASYGSPPPYTQGMSVGLPPQSAPPPQGAPPNQGAQAPQEAQAPMYDNAKPPVESI